MALATGPGSSQFEKCQARAVKSSVEGEDMPKVATILQVSVVDAYRDAIENHVKESHYTDALEKLIDFTRDCCPEKRRDSVSLYSRYSRWKSAERQGLEQSDLGHVG